MKWKQAAARWERLGNEWDLPGGMVEAARRQSGGPSAEAYFWQGAWLPKPVEWWTPICQAHEKPMAGENRFSLSSHGHGDSEVPATMEDASLASSLLFRSMFNVQCSMFDVRCSMFVEGWTTNEEAILANS